MFAFKIRPSLARISSVVCVCLAVVACTSGEEPQKPVGLHQPVFRVSKQAGPRRDEVAAAKPQHPLDPALDIAHESLTHIRKTLDDYTCVIIKRERVDGELGDPQFMFAKIRNQKKHGDNTVVPFAVYLKFLKPEGIKGREVIYVEGQNDGNLMAHEGGWKGKALPTISLSPLGRLAMMGQRYPITEIGVETLCLRLIEKGTRDKALGDCIVHMQPAKINKRPCMRIQVTHEEPLPHLDFHLARIFVDDEHEVPVRYEAYDFPKTPGANVSQDDLIEEYTYVNMKLNVGLTDRDFDPANPDYNMQ